MKSEINLAGRMRERIRFFRPTAVRDALGGATEPPLELGEYWAALQSRDPGPATEAAARTARPRWDVIMRTQAEILPGDQAIWRGRQMRVLSARDEIVPEPLRILVMEKI